MGRSHKEIVGGVFLLYSALSRHRKASALIVQFVLFFHCPFRKCIWLLALCKILSCLVSGWVQHILHFKALYYRWITVMKNIKQCFNIPFLLLLFVVDQLTLSHIINHFSAISLWLLVLTEIIFQTGYYVYIIRYYVVWLMLELYCLFLHFYFFVMLLIFRSYIYYFHIWI